MKYHKSRQLSIILFFLCFLCVKNLKAQEKTEIVIVGTLHFQQFHNPEKVSTNFLGDQRQEEFSEVVKALATFNPDAVCIERKFSMQNSIDSLFALDKLDYALLDDGLSEVYHIGFELAKKQKLSTVYGVDYYESVSQNLFESGDNLTTFTDSLKAFQLKGRSITKAFLQGEMSVKEFLYELNRPENIRMSYRLFYNTPAYVHNGAFKGQEGFTAIDNEYIGAEYISIFYERNLKIYSNILRIQQQTQAKRIVVILGQVHVGVLESLLNENAHFKVISANQYLSN